MRATVALASLAVITAAPAHADSDRSRALPKKQQYMAAKASGGTALAVTSVSSEAKKRAWKKQLDALIGKKPTEVVTIYNTWTHEFVVVDAVKKANLGKTEANEFLRCHFTNESTTMDPRLMAVLLKAAAHFKVNRIDIISGFRAPKYNLMLRKKGRGVARRSQHPMGNAVDFRLPGVSTTRLRNWARSLRLGGVGYYPSSGFVHVDTGPVRTWKGR